MQFVQVLLRCPLLVVERPRAASDEGYDKDDQDNGCRRLEHAPDSSPAQNWHAREMGLLCGFASIMLGFVTLAGKRATANP